MANKIIKYHDISHDQNILLVIKILVMSYMRTKAIKHVSE